MENQRLLVWATFGMLAWLTYQSWTQDYGPQPVEAVQPTADESLQPPNADESLPALPQATADSSLDAPQIQHQAPAAQSATESTVVDDSVIVHVVTDVLDVEINTRGATLQRASLNKYPVAKDQPDTLVELLNPSMPDFGLVQTGLRAAGDGEEANHLALFESAATYYELGGADEIVVPLVWTDGQGIRVEKEIRFTRGSYRVDITQRVINDSGTEWRGAEYAQLQRRSIEVERSMFDVDTYSFDGPIIYDGDKSEKLKRDDLQSDGPFAVAAQAGWIGAIQHHFLTAVVPPDDGDYRYNVSVRGDTSTASLIGPAQTVSSGAEHLFTTTIFVGPKLQEQLEGINESLKLTVDYGWLTIISQPLFWLLSKVHSVIGNWGLAIILVTIMIKMVFYKLTEASGRSMAKMREIQPRMKALQDRYKDDRQALSQAMMELYKREKVNPAAGCLPILIQMPFFLAFYWVLLESVEMRQAPFALWITDLSSRDPYFILPIIMGAAMLFQQRLNPAPADPVQAKVMQVMPIIFTVFFAFFPAGLVLYWVTNTGLSIAQQWYINKIVHEEATARKSGKKKKDKAKS
ncbi:MAG: membrane protein insertase YidC [Gammaproteobacteria bacterium]|nr:MAG: membrane protein insertase YidC [Gammaproteobacteria bacterium]